jgi:hypothetical protein
LRSRSSPNGTLIGRSIHTPQKWALWSRRSVETHAM